MEFDDAGLKFVKGWEGDIPYVYDDLVYPTRIYKRGSFTPTKGMLVAKGTLTAGMGHTAASDIEKWIGKESIPQHIRDAWARVDTHIAVSAVNNLVKVTINQKQFNALASLVFNIGVSAFKGSTLLKKLNKGDYKGAVQEFARWNKSKGKVLGGLVKRRAAEAALFADGLIVDTPANVQPKHQAPSWVTPETVSTAITGVSGAGAIANGDGPFQYALAAVFVVAALAAIGFFVWKRVVNK